jgi:hypothetical protein
LNLRLRCHSPARQYASTPWDHAIVRIYGPTASKGVLNARIGQVYVQLR